MSNNVLSIDGVAPTKTFDVLFKVHNTVFSCEQAVIGSASKLFSEVFANASEYYEHKGDGYSVSWNHTKRMPLIEIDAKPEGFEAINEFCYSSRLDVDSALIAAVYQLACRFCFDAVRLLCASKLVASINVNNIGEICQVSRLNCSQDEDNRPTDNEMLASLRLAESKLTVAVRDFVVKNADAIACSQTGQLWARLFVDVHSAGYESARYPSSSTSREGAVDFTEPRLLLDTAVSDWTLTDKVLSWVSNRLHSEQPLDVVERRRKSSRAEHSTATETVTQELRMMVMEEDLFLITNQESPPSRRRGNLDGYAAAKASDLETDVCDESKTDTETCLIASTSLGVGSICIHIGKLAGRLVSLSVKRCVPTPQSSPFSANSDGKPFGWGVSPCRKGASVVLPPSPPLERFPMPDGSQLSTAGNDRHCPGEIAAECDDTGHQEDETFFRRPCYVMSPLGCILSRRLTTPRTAAGACSLKCSQLLSDVTSQDNSVILIAGGYERLGCLSSVELIVMPTASSIPRTDFQQLVNGNSEDRSADFKDDLEGSGLHRGPRLIVPRGRLALAALELEESQETLIFACGGSTGTKDLSSVECLTSTALREWLSIENASEPLPAGGATHPWRFVAPLQQQRSRAASTVLPAGFTFDKPGVVVLGGQVGQNSLNTVEIYNLERDTWQKLPAMREARSQACAATIASRNLLLAVGGCSTTFEPSPNLTTAGQSLIECRISSASAEAFDPRCASWIQLPELPTRGPLFGASLVPLASTSGRMLLLGGSDGQSALCETAVFDPVAWRWLSGPSLTLGRANPCAVSLESGTCVAVLGGFNVDAGGFLDSIELVTVDSFEPDLLKAGWPNFTPSLPLSSCLNGSVIPSTDTAATCQQSVAIN